MSDILDSTIDELVAERELATKAFDEMRTLYATANGNLTIAWRDLTDERAKVTDLRIHLESVRSDFRRSEKLRLEAEAERDAALARAEAAEADAAMLREKYVGPDGVKIADLALERAALRALIGELLVLVKEWAPTSKLSLIKRAEAALVEGV